MIQKSSNGDTQVAYPEKSFWISCTSAFFTWIDLEPIGTRASCPHTLLGMDTSIGHCSNQVISLETGLVHLIEILGHEILSHNPRAGFLGILNGFFPIVYPFLQTWSFQIDNAFVLHIRHCPVDMAYVLLTVRFRVDRAYILHAQERHTFRGRSYSVSLLLSLSLRHVFLLVYKLMTARQGASISAVQHFTDLLIGLEFFV